MTPVFSGKYLVGNDEIPVFVPGYLSGVDPPGSLRYPGFSGVRVVGVTHCLSELFYYV